MSTPTHRVRRPWTNHPAGLLVNPKALGWRNTQQLEKHGYIVLLTVEEVEEAKAHPDLSGSKRAVEPIPVVETTQPGDVNKAYAPAERGPDRAGERGRTAAPTRLPKD